MLFTMRYILNIYMAHVLQCIAYLKCILYFYTLYYIYHTYSYNTNNHIDRSYLFLNNIIRATIINSIMYSQPGSLPILAATSCSSYTKAPKRKTHHPNWLVVSTPLKNLKVRWDYYSQLEKNMFQTTNRPKVKLFPPSDPFFVVNWNHFAQPQRSKKAWPYHRTMGRTKKIQPGSMVFSHCCGQFFGGQLNHIWQSQSH